MVAMEKKEQDPIRILIKYVINIPGNVVSIYLFIWN